MKKLVTIISAILFGCSMLMAQMYGYRDGEIIWQHDPYSLDSVVFRVPVLTITAMANDSEMGVVSGGGEYAYGTEVKLTASANEGYEFVQWQNGSTNSELQIIVTASATYVAYFESVVLGEDSIVGVTVQVNHPGMGSVSGVGSYTSGESVTVSAVANEGYEFVRWSDGETAAVRTFTIAENTNFFAEFRATGLAEGAIDGKFSVSATKQVRFSKGNLQYQASTGDWRFAENQYDMIGEANSNISSTYNGYIDLFGWGTSGYGGIMPYSTSDYAFKKERENISYTNYDWGQYNAISNGGGKAGLWRTLSYDEWNYLLNSRANASELYSQATVNGVKGLILLPDEWTAPLGIFFLPKTNDWTSNTYSTAEWMEMESAGAVFIPAAGFRYSSGLDYIGAYGFVWSASCYDYLSNHANCLSFDSGIVDLFPYYRFDGRSVRLAQDFI